MDSSKMDLNMEMVMRWVVFVPNNYFLFGVFILGRYKKKNGTIYEGEW